MNSNIPASDLSEFGLLPPRIRAEVNFWIDLIGIIEESKPILPAIQQAAEKHRLSQATIYRKRRDYKIYGCRGLVNRAKHPSNPPPASSNTFLHFLHSLWLANNKNYTNTHLQLIAIWKGGAPIPGYDELPPESPFNEFPVGWTMDNLRYHIITFRENHPEGLASR
jgi:hypothetical protein